MKLLLYCTKAKPYLVYHREYCSLSPTEYIEYGYETRWEDKHMLEDVCNGNVVAECDYEVEDVFYELYGDLDWQHDYLPTTNTMSIVNLENAACMDREKIEDQMTHGKAYAIHIKNLHIFDEPKELSDYYTKKSYKDINKMFTDELMIDGEWYRPIYKAPQNMMYCTYYGLETNVLISIRPEWLCKILNGEKTIEVRKKVLKEMIK